MKRILGLVGVVTLCVVYTRAEGYARSFQQFHGPVNGADKEVTWTDHHGRHHEDYVANPHYEFAYGVEDPNTGERHGQKEHRDGNIIYHYFSLLLNLLVCQNIMIIFLQDKR